MLGISISVAVEKLTNRGTLQQIGIPTPSIVVLALLLVAFLGASAYGAFKTERKFNSGRMSDKEMRRYRRVLLLEGEEEEIRSGIAESKVKGTAVDRMLAPLTKEAYSTDSDNAEERSTVRQAVTPKEVPASVQDVQAAFSDDYLREIGVVVRQKGPLEVVEDIGGRLAMVGFLAAILVEAGSGRGILRQGMFWAKILGLAPPDVMDLAYYDDTMSYFQ